MSISSLTEEMRINEYLRSLIDPASYSADIPDDLMRPHINRSETITHNLRVTDNGSGIIVLWPNNPTSIIGAHYTYDGANLVFDKLLESAQDLGHSYNYGRKVSQVLRTKSSTVPSGVYALNGTINAIEYEGTLSEIPDVSYSKILQQTSNPLDKIGGVMIGDGVTSLSLPRGWDQPFVRLGDKSPSLSNSDVSITSDGGTLVYTHHDPSTSIILDQPHDVIFNMDALDDVEFNISTIINQAAIPSTGSQRLAVQIQMFGLGNHTVYEETLNHYFTPTEQLTPAVTMTKLVTRSARTSEAPVVGANITISTGSDSRLETLTIEARCRNTNHTGYQNPTAVLAYENVASGSVLTVSGVANYELIPNSDLQKNLKTTYGKNNPAHLNVVKMILANREQANIRSLMTGGDYSKLLGRQDYYWNNEKLATTAASGGFLNFLKTIGNIAAPIVGTLFPPAAPIAGAINSVVQGLSAGGKPQAHSAGGSAYSAGGRPRRLALSADGPEDESDQAKVKIDLGRNTLLCCISGSPKQARAKAGTDRSPKEPAKPTAAASGDTPNPQVLREDTTGENPLRGQLTIDITSTTGALFPVVLLNEDHSVNTQRPAMAYMAVKLDDTVKSQLPDYTQLPSYTQNGITVYNAEEPKASGPSSDVASGDFILLPVANYHEGRLTTLASAPSVSGGSHQLAVVAASEAHLKGYTGIVPRALFTGSLTGHTVNQVYYMQLKASLARSLALPMFGNSPYTIKMRSAKQMFNLIETMRPLEALMAGSLEALTGRVFSSDIEAELDAFLREYDEPEESLDVVGTQPSPAPAAPTEVAEQAFIEAGQEPVTDEDKVSTIEEFLLQDLSIVDDMFTLITLGYGQSMRNSLQAQAANAANQYSLKKNPRDSLADKLRRVRQAGRLVTAEMVGPRGIITPEILQGAPKAPKAPNTARIKASISNIWENNATLRSEAESNGFTLDGVQDMAAQVGFVPTPAQLLTMVSGGEAPDRPAQQTRASKRNYTNYTQMAPEHEEEIKAMVDEVYERNGGKGPSSEQNNRLVGEIRALKTGRSSSGRSQPARQARAPRPAGSRLQSFLANRSGML